MWLSKKKYNEMMDRIKKLEDCHYRITNPFDNTFKDYHFNHNFMSFNTREIKDVTLQELASYVIDHKPIIRKEKIEVTKKYF